MICSSLSSPKAIPPDMSTVAVSGTLKTFQPMLSKKVASFAYKQVVYKKLLVLGLYGPWAYTVTSPSSEPSQPVSQPAI